MRLPAILLITATALCATPTSAIVTRHDRQESQYRALAQDFPMVCQIGGGVGTLIAPQWVVTAAHVAQQGVSRVTFGDRSINIAESFVHPDFAKPGSHRDIGLIKLATPVTDITPAVLHNKMDELGQTVLFVGNGHTGTGLTGPHRGERIMRGAHNVVSEVEPGWVNFIFDTPPAGLDLEGISGPGDSGGPALIKVDGQWHVIGVSAFNDVGQLCTYGTKEHYGRVADERVWLDGVMDGSITAHPTASTLRHGVTADGKPTVVREEAVEVVAEAGRVEATAAVARVLAAALNAEDLPTFRATMNEHYLNQEGAAGIQGMFNFVQEGRGAHGDIATMHPVKAKALDLLDSEAPMLIALWHYADGLSGYFGIALDDDGLIEHFSLFVRRGLCDGGRNCSLGEDINLY